MTAPHSLRLNLLTTPYHLRRGRLALWWCPAADQAAYRVVVTQGRHTAVYDSGWVDSSACSAVRPAGMAEILKDGVLYYVSVATRDVHGSESDFSTPLGFTVAPEPRSAAGIWAAEGDFALLRRIFTIPSLGEIDRLLITAAATNPEPSRQFPYTLYVNGTEVGAGAFRLGKTPWGEDVIYSQTYDVTPLLREGENCVAAACYALSDRGFACTVTAFGADGTPRVLFSTEEADGWQALNADSVFGKDDGLSIGTHYFKAHACNLHAPTFPFGFAEANLEESADWPPALSVGELMGGLSLLPEETEPVRRYPSPVAAVTALADGSLLVDLGREIIGGLRMEVDSPEVCAVTLTYGEQLTPDGSAVKCPMNTGNRYVETWTLREGTQTLETLNMMAFRYVRITGCPEALRSRITADRLWGLELRKPFDESASAFTSNDPLLCDLYGLVKHTVKVTSQDIYVDSQSRERGAYEGDLLINMLAAYAVEDSFAPARLTVEYLLGHRTWPADYLLMIIFAAYADYMATGDASLLEEWYDTLKADLFTDFMDANGLIRSPVIGMSQTNAVLVDWPPSERDGYEMECPYNTVFNALNLRAYEDMAKIAAVLGRDTDALDFSLRAQNLRRAMIEALYDPATGRFFDGIREDGSVSLHAAQHATAFCLDCGVYDTPAMADAMAAAPASDGAIRMSVYGAFFLLDGLYRTGHGEAANRLMLDTNASEGARTWAYVLYGLGATVSTEAWNEKNKPNMTLSHPWGAAPAHMIASGVLGVTPTSPAFETFDLRVSPHGIGEASGIIPTIRGGIGVAFRSCEEELELTVTVPSNTEATVYLPSGEVKTVGSGAHTFRS